METGIVYKWTNNLNGKWYIGSHRGTVEDRYTASGLEIKKAFKEYGLPNFTREILYEGTSFREKETQILTEVGAMQNPDSYNMKNLATGFAIGAENPTKRPEVQAKISKALKGKTWEELLGDSRAAERREKQKNSLKGTKTGINNPAKRPEVRAAISATLKGRKPSWTGKPKPPEQLARQFITKYCKNLSEEEQNRIFKEKVKQYKNQIK
jgi:group I intron endonuclease